MGNSSTTEALLVTWLAGVGAMFIVQFIFTSLILGKKTSANAAVFFRHFVPGLLMSVGVAWLLYADFIFEWRSLGWSKIVCRRPEAQMLAAYALISIGAVYIVDSVSAMLMSEHSEEATEETVEDETNAEESKKEKGKRFLDGFHCGSPTGFFTIYWPTVASVGALITTSLVSAFTTDEPSPLCPAVRTTDRTVGWIEGDIVVAIALGIHGVQFIYATLLWAHFIYRVSGDSQEAKHSQHMLVEAFGHRSRQHAIAAVGRGHGHGSQTWPVAKAWIVLTLVMLVLANIGVAIGLVFMDPLPFPAVLDGAMLSSLLLAFWMMVAIFAYVRSSAVATKEELAALNPTGGGRRHKRPYL